MRASALPPPADSGRWTAIWFAVEVGVEGVADQGVNLDRLTLDGAGASNAWIPRRVQGRRPVEQHRVLVDDLLEARPRPRRSSSRPIFLAALMFCADLRSTRAGHDERLEQLQRHESSGRAALVQLEGTGPRRSPKASGSSPRALPSRF